MLESLNSRNLMVQLTAMTVGMEAAGITLVIPLSVMQLNTFCKFLQQFSVDKQFPINFM